MVSLGFTMGSTPTSADDLGQGRGVGLTAASTSLSGGAEFAVVGALSGCSGPFESAVVRNAVWDDTVFIACNQAGSVAYIRDDSVQDAVSGVISLPGNSRPTYLAVGGRDTAASSDDTVYVAGDTPVLVSVVPSGAVVAGQDTIVGSWGAEIGGLAASQDDTLYLFLGSARVGVAGPGVKGPNLDDSFQPTSGGVTFYLNNPVAIDDTLFGNGSWGEPGVSADQGVAALSMTSRTVDDSASFPTDVSPGDLTASDDTLFYVPGTHGGSTIWALDPRTMAVDDSLTLEMNVRGIKASPGGLIAARGLASDFSWNKVEVLDGSSMTHLSTVSLPSGADVASLALTRSGVIYAGDYSSNIIYRIAKVTPTLSASTGATGTAVTLSLAPSAPSVTVDDTTIESVTFGGSTVTTSAMTKVGNSYSFAVPAGSGTVPVTVNFRGGNSSSLGSWTYQPNLSITHGGFGTVTLDDTSESTFTITNNTSATLVLSSPALTLSGDDSADFIISSDGCSSASISAGNSCTAVVMFAPSIAGTRTATLSVQSDAHDSPHTAVLTGVASSYPLPPGCPATSDYVVNLLYMLRTDGFMNYGDGTHVLGPVPTVGVQTLNLPGSAPYDLKVTVSTDDSQSTVIATNKMRIGGSTQTIDRREFGLYFVMNYGIRYYVSYRLLALDGPDGDQLYGSRDGTTLACSPTVSFKSELADASAYVQANYVAQSYPANTDYNGTKGVGAGGMYGCGAGGLSTCPMFLGANPYAPGGLFYQAPDAPVIGSVQSPADDSIAIEINVSDLPEVAEVQFTTDDGSTWDRGMVQFTTVDDSSLDDATPKADIRAGSGTVIIQAPSSGGALSPSSTYKVRIRSVNNDPGNAAVSLTTLYGTATNTICVQPGTGQVSCPVTPPPGGGGGGGAPAPVEPSPSPDPSPGPVPSPAPVPVTDPVPPGTGQVVVGGVPQDLRIEPVPDRTGLVVVGEDFELGFTSEDDDAQRELVDPDGALSLGSGVPVTLRGNGYAPGSELAVYLVDSPDGTAGTSVADRSWWARTVIGGIGLSSDDSGAVRDLAAVLVDDSGAFVLDLVVPDGTPAGDYVLQVVGATAENATRALSLGVRVQEVPVEPSLSISGSREVRDGRKFAVVQGSSTGLEGVVVFPRFRLRGQTSYADGKARRVIAEDGSFDWQRRGGKKLYLFFMTEDQQTRSNGITIR